MGPDTEVTYDRGAPINPPKVVNGVPVDKYNKDVKKAGTSGFIKGFVTSIVLALVAAGGLYLASGFGDQKKYELVEPNYNLPELKEDVVEDSGSLESGDAEVETVDE